jgi:hypothetical protein
MDFMIFLTVLYADDIDLHTSEVNTTQDFEVSTFDTDDELRERAELLVKSGYGRYLLDLLDRAG